jgi:competence protein ComEC
LHVFYRRFYNSLIKIWYVFFMHKVNFSKSFFVKVGLIVFLICAAGSTVFFEKRFFVDEIGFYGNVKSSLTVEGGVFTEPAFYSDQIRLVLDADKIVSGSFEKDVVGKLMVILPRYPEYKYGDCLRLTGVIERTSFGDFAYGDYLAKDNVYASMYQPWVVVSEGNCGAHEWEFIYNLKTIINNRIGELFSEPSGSIVSGLLLGIRRAIPQNIIDDFSATGLTHILAISGYNITLVISIFGLFLKGFSRRARFFMTFFGIFVFVVLTGMSASVIRAALMGALVIVGMYNGRRSSGVHCLLWGAALMSLQNPRIILFDMSFQLSFLATLGILIFMPCFEKLAERFGVGDARADASGNGVVVGEGVRAMERLGDARADVPDWVIALKKQLYEGFAVTIAAQIFTTPLILFRFGRMSIIAPIANVIFLPLIPFIMLFSFAAIIVSFVIWPVSIPVAGAAFLLCDLLLKGVAFTADVPFASFLIPSFPLWMMIVCYAVTVGAIISFRIPRSDPCLVTHLSPRDESVPMCQPGKCKK